ncbi:hypothetical protein ACET3Z_003751 [Daucus carota]
MSLDIKPNDFGEGSSRSVTEQNQQLVSAQPAPAPLSRYESQKRRDWNTFGQYLKNQRPPVALPQFRQANYLNLFIKVYYAALVQMDTKCQGNRSLLRKCFIPFPSVADHIDSTY